MADVKGKCEKLPEVYQPQSKSLKKSSWNQKRKPAVVPFQRQQNQIKILKCCRKTSTGRQRIKQTRWDPKKKAKTDSNETEHSIGTDESAGATEPCWNSFFFIPQITFFSNFLLNPYFWNKTKMCFVLPEIRCIIYSKNVAKIMVLTDEMFLC